MDIERDRYLLQLSKQLVKKQEQASKERAAEDEMIKEERARSAPQGNSYFFVSTRRSNM